MIKHIYVNVQHDGWTAVIKRPGNRPLRMSGMSAGSDHYQWRSGIISGLKNIGEWEKSILHLPARSHPIIKYLVDDVPDRFWGDVQQLLDETRAGIMVHTNSEFEELSE
jgi:hypothetical protein